MSSALEIAMAEVNAYNKSNGGTGGIAHVARKIGIGRSSLSLFLSGNYTAATEKLEAKILGELVNRVPCPHMQVDIALRECESFATRPMPMSSPREFRHWKACQACKLNPAGGRHAK